MHKENKMSVSIEQNIDGTSGEKTEGLKAARQSLSVFV